MTINNDNNDNNNKSNNNSSANDEESASDETNNDDDDNNNNNNNNNNNHHHQSLVFIDNTHLVYVPITLKRSQVTCMCRPAILQQQCFPFLLQTLDDDVMSCFRLLPCSVHGLIERTKLWINVTYQYGSIDHPTIVHHTTTHHYAQWLLYTQDVVAKCGGIEIYNAHEYQRMRLHWNGNGGLLLHEYCHLIHQQVFGLDCTHIEQLYQKNAAKEGQSNPKYKTVVRRDWAGKSDGCTTDLAYAMINAKEFFAEMSVTYWSRGYYTELDAAPHDQLPLCTPLIIEPNVISRIVQQSSSQSLHSQYAHCIYNPYYHSYPKMHCNKFYPFTAGQLQHYDPELYQAMHELWTKIAMWKDPFDNNKNKNKHNENDDNHCCSCGGCCYDWLLQFWKRNRTRKHNQSSLWFHDNNNNNNNHEIHNHQTHKDSNNSNHNCRKNNENDLAKPLLETSDDHPMTDSTTNINHNSRDFKRLIHDTVEL